MMWVVLMVPMAPRVRTLDGQLVNPVHANLSNYIDAPAVSARLVYTKETDVRGTLENYYGFMTLTWRDRK